MIGGSKMFEQHKKESPIISLAGVGGGAASYIFYSASGGGGGDNVVKELSRSLRFDSSTNTYLVRTPGSTGNRKTFTWAGWVKKSTTTSNTTFFSAGSDGSNRSHFMFDGTTHALRFFDLPTSTGVITTQYLTDVGAWYHLVLVVDTTQSTPADRVKFYINGKKVTEFASSPAYPAEDALMQCNTQNVPNRLGSGIAYGEHFSGYLADVHLLDGTAVGDTNGVIDEFGFFDSYNVWQPKAYSGSHGTNGFNLTFSTTTTSQTLGNDSSSNNNHFTVYGQNADAYDYASNVTGTGSGGASQIDSSYPISNLFDGNNNTYAATDAANISSNAAVLTINFPSGYQPSWASSLQVEVWAGSTDTCTATFNGGSSQSVSGSTDWVTHTLNSGSGILTQITFSRQKSNTNAGRAEVRKIIVDGVDLLNNNYAEIDSLRDTPTNLTADSGNNIGNYCTLNPLDRQASNGVLANGNLDLKQTSGAWAMYRGTMSMSSGKWYWEVTFGNDQYSMIGIIPTDYLMSTSSNYWPAQVPNGYVFYPYTGNKYDNTSLQNYAGADTSGTGDVYGIALDLDAGTMTYYKNGTSLGQAHSGMRADTYAPVAALYNQANYDSYNFGQRAFKYPPGSVGGPPATYKALCSQNLSTVGAGSTLFDIDLYDGTGSALERSNFSFSPEFLWIKQRSGSSTSHALFDVCRGGSKRLQSNERNSEVDVDQYGGGITSFDADGFTLGTWSTINANSENYVAWAWEAGGVPTTDNVAAAGQVPTAGSAKINGANMTSSLAGTIQITRLTANTHTGLSIITFENPSSQETLGHGLGKKPEMMWVKSRDTGGNSNPWQVYHRGIGNNVKLYLDGTDSTVSSSVWGTTDPTSTLFTLNDNVADSWVAYVWTSVEGFSYFGSYEGGSTPFVPCGFQPKWVMVKNADMNGEEWIILDRERDPSNVAGHTLYADNATYEVDYRTGGNARSVSFLSNGFKVNGGNPLNQSGTHIFAAFAENPFQSARAR